LDEIVETPAPAEQEQPPAEQQPSAWGRYFLDALETVLMAVILFLVINMISARVRVDGVSMRPTFENGEFVLVNRLAYRFGEPERGDIVVFHYPLDPQSQDLIKRAIGIPGDVILIEDGKVIVNGTTLNEPYIAASPRYNGKWNVPEGHLFVLGDNRNNSSDSHSWGMVPYEQIMGKATLIYYPFTDFAIITHADLLLSSQTP
jgi:signal peptidase I